MDLEKTYKKILKANQRSHKGFRYTIPSSSVYPHQWMWDSCFHSIIYTHFDIKYAKDEMRSLLHGQWENGMIPHMIYWKYSSKQKENWGTKKNTLSITQPPMMAYAVEKIYKKDQDKKFLIEVLDKLHNHYKWLQEARGSEYLLSIVHPWESGEDDFVPWDDVYGLTNPSKKEIDKHKLKILSDYVKLGADSRKFLSKHEFNVKCLLFNTVYLRNLQSMLFLCEAAKSNHAKYYTDLIPKVKKAYNSILYHKGSGLYYSVYNNDHCIKNVDNSSMFVPLFANAPTKANVAKLVKNYLLDDEKFWIKYPIPTISLDNDSFQPNSYWRGSSWININWFVYKGLKEYGFNDAAKELKKRTKNVLTKSGFHEYFNPINGLGHGAPDFSWSGIYFDMN